MHYGKQLTQILRSWPSAPSPTPYCAPHSIHCMNLGGHWLLSMLLKQRDDRGKERGVGDRGFTSLWLGVGRPGPVLAILGYQWRIQGSNPAIQSDSLAINFEFDIRPREVRPSIRCVFVLNKTLA